MFTARAEGSYTFQLHPSKEKDKFKVIVNQILPQFDKIIHSYLMYNVIMWSLLLVQAFVLMIFLPFLLKSALMAVALALFVLTFFAYLVIREYLYSQKSAKLENLKYRFLQACEGVSKVQSFAEACTLLAEELHKRECSYFKAPKWFNRSTPVMEKFSSKLHWKDVFKMQEALLLQGIAEKIQKVKREPISLEAHAELAKAYIMLSGLYVSPQYPVEDSEKKFKEASLKAIEEFKIIKEYAPEDPWVYEQLAFSYHDLKMPLEEMREYENILVFKPQSADILSKLGKLYFVQGQNGKGLKIYEQLKRLNPTIAEEVISHYGGILN